MALLLCGATVFVGEHKEDSVTKTLEILQTVGVALQNLDLVIATFGKSICIGAEK